MSTQPDGVPDLQRDGGWAAYVKLRRTMTVVEAENRQLREVLEDILRDLGRAYDDPRLALSRADIRAHIRASNRVLGKEPQP